MYEDIFVEWSRIEEARGGAWQSWRCLYIYVNPGDESIVYLGKADRCTVRERCHGRQKDDLRGWLVGNEVGAIDIRVGHIDWGDGRRYSPEKLSDVETLLIKRLQIKGNISATRRRITRPCIRVYCEGEWPHARCCFVDRG